jgi:hypothetical protein
MKKPEKPKEKKRRRNRRAAIAIPFPDGFTCSKTELWLFLNR